ncbi:hypothetical protein LEN26_008272 [Aphanomyces euteiches]|nr:hypothetical protein AeMF1_004134 [Aphanomyces euteiches]KAH9130710.1 hypothetical protein LEN26_008272 [Aphanomyces euteiches]KAH9188824.1 hypothetical protein AeNC1_009203 [Aphanomyces euteiches]
MPPRHPLWELSFDVPQLHSTEKLRLISMAQSICRQTVGNAMKMQEAPIKTSVKNRRTQRIARICQGRDTVDPSLEGMCAFTQVSSTIEEIADFFHLNSPDKVETFVAVTGQRLLDHRKIYTLLERNTPPRSTGGQTVNPLHYIGIDWMATKSPLFFADRDMCYIECHDEFEFYDTASDVKRRGFVRAMNSINLKCVPSLKHSLNITRSHIYRSGYVFFETDDPDTLDFFCVIVQKPDGLRHPNLLAMQRHCARSLNVEEYLQARRMNAYLHRGIFESVVNYQCKDATASCMRCQKKFGFFFSKKHCRICGLVVCSSCSKRWDLELRNSIKALVRVCKTCFDGGSFSNNHNPSTSQVFNMKTPLAVSPTMTRRRTEPLKSTSDEQDLDELSDLTLIEGHRAQFRQGIFSFRSNAMSILYSSKESSFSPYPDSMDDVSMACHPRNGSF